jgi:hypothetical protein
MPERARAGVERLLREHRQQDVEVEAEAREHDHHPEDHERRCAGARVGEALARAAQEKSAACPVDGNISDGRISSRLASTARKLTAFAAKHQPTPTAAITMPPSAGRRSRDVEQARVERDGVRQLVAADHLERERLARGRVEDERGARERRDRVDVPRRRVPGHGVDREHALSTICTTA